MGAAIDFKKQLKLLFFYSFFNSLALLMIFVVAVGFGVFNWPTLGGISSDAAHSWAPLLLPLHLPSVSPFFHFGPGQ